MKKFVAILLLMAVGVILDASSKQKIEVAGSVVDKESKAIAYVTIALRNSADSTLIYGAVTNEQGAFTINVPPADYELTASFLGYKTVKTNVSIASSTVVAPLRLDDDAIAIDNVVVTASSITRRANSFMVNMDNSGVAKGRSTYEALAFAPGVMIQDGIKINGNGGTQVYVNNRLLNLGGKDLENYLQSIAAEDVVSIEVVPISGSEYDASATGGVIKITLRSQRSGGYSGAINANGGLSSYGVKEAVIGGNVSYRKKKFSLYVNANYSKSNFTERYWETTQYKNTDNKISSYTEGVGNFSNIRGEVSGVYDISDKQNIGLLVRYSNSGKKMSSESTTDLYSAGATTLSALNSPSDEISSRINASMDYNLIFGSKGATFKANVDYSNNASDTYTDFHTIYDNATTPDRIYNSTIKGPGEIFSANVDFKIPIGEKYTIKAGAKFYNMNINNSILYMDKIGDNWVKDENQSEEFSYNESVGAMYVEASANYGKFMATLGMRGEYSWIDIDSEKEGGDLRKNYFNPFPSLTLFYNMNEEKGHSLSLNANMKISRPSYSMLRPFTIPLNEYTYIVGNPELDPVITSRVSLTQTIFNKYSLSLTAAYVKDPIAQLSVQSETDPTVLYYKNMNIDSRVEFGASLFIPVDITKWWKVTANLMAMNRSENYLNSLNESVSNRQNTFAGNVNSIFKLPAGFQIDLSGFYMSPMAMGNFVTKEMYSVDAGVTKSLLKDKLSLTLTYRGILVSKQHLSIDDPAYSKINVGVRDNQYLRLSLRYNFRGGEKVNVRKATSGSDEQSGRL